MFQKDRLWSVSSRYSMLEMSNSQNAVPLSVIAQQLHLQQRFNLYKFCAAMMGSYNAAMHMTRRAAIQRSSDCASEWRFHNSRIHHIKFFYVCKPSMIAFAHTVYTMLIYHAFPAGVAKARVETIMIKQQDEQIAGLP